MLSSARRSALPAIVLLAFISGCTTAPVQAPPPIEDRSRPVPPAAQSVDATPSPAAPGTDAAPAPAPSTQPQPLPSPNPAVIALRDEANSYRQQGDYRTSQDRLQRAQRIAPRDPLVYYDLAQTHLALESYALAEQVALKGVSLVQQHPEQLRQFWQLIARIRLRAGDAEGARQAEQKAASY